MNCNNIFAANNLHAILFETFLVCFNDLMCQRLNDATSRQCVSSAIEKIIIEIRALHTLQSFKV